MTQALEPPRDKPRFVVMVHHLGSGPSAVDITDAVMDVYDIAINSMDFGSGFLSTEEVDNLRALGEAIGAELVPERKPAGQKAGPYYDLVPRA